MLIFACSDSVKSFKLALGSVYLATLNVEKFAIFQIVQQSGVFGIGMPAQRLLRDGA